MSDGIAMRFINYKNSNFIVEKWGRCYGNQVIKSYHWDTKLLGQSGVQGYVIGCNKNTK